MKYVWLQTNSAASKKAGCLRRWFYYDLIIFIVLKPACICYHVHGTASFYVFFVGNTIILKKLGLFHFFAFIKNEPSFGSFQCDCFAPIWSTLSMIVSRLSLAISSVAGIPLIIAHLKRSHLLAPFLFIVGYHFGTLTHARFHFEHAIMEICALI